MKLLLEKFANQLLMDYGSCGQYQKMQINTGLLVENKKNSMNQAKKNKTWVI